MECTDKERQSCIVEKMGCAGCYFANKNEEVINKEIPNIFMRIE